MKKKLSICIPTYKRLTQLKRALSAIQITNEYKELVEIIVIDNDSGVNIEDELVEYKEKFDNISIYANCINIGGNGNIARCIEFASGEWVWLLGDDDVPTENAIHIIMNTIENLPNNNITLIKYSSELGKVKNDIEMNNFDTFIKFVGENDLFSNLLFMSSGIIKREWYINYFVELMERLSCNFVQIWPVVRYMNVENANCSVFFSNEKICNWLDTETISWTPSIVYFKILEGFNNIPSISEKTKKYIATKWVKISLKQIFICIRDLYFYRNYSEQECNYYYKKYIEFVYGKKRFLMFPVLQLMYLVLYKKIRK